MEMGVTARREVVIEPSVVARGEIMLFVLMRVITRREVTLTSILTVL